MNPCSTITTFEKQLAKEAKEKMKSLKRKQKVKIYKNWRKIFKKIIIKVRSQNTLVKAVADYRSRHPLEQKIDLNVPKNVKVKKRLKKKVKNKKIKQEKQPKGNSRINNIMRITENQLRKLLKEVIGNHPFANARKLDMEAEAKAEADEAEFWDQDTYDEYLKNLTQTFGGIQEDYFTECYDDFVKEYEPPAKKAKSAGGKKSKNSGRTNAFTPYKDEGCVGRMFGGRRCCKATHNEGGGGGELCGLHQRSTETMGKLGEPLTDKLRASMKKSKSRMHKTQAYGELFMSRARWEAQEGEDWVATHLNPIFTSADKNHYFFNSEEDFQAAKVLYLGGTTTNEFMEEEKVNAVATLHKEEVEKDDGGACSICDDATRDEEPFYHFWDCVHLVHKDCGLKWRNKDANTSADWKKCPICRVKALKRMKKMGKSKF
tara:strand:- start:46 stop:1338 length:1293 start_codon:yes stop_codon:yes gene_type:complete